MKYQTSQKSLTIMQGRIEIDEKELHLLKQ